MSWLVGIVGRLFGVSPAQALMGLAVAGFVVACLGSAAVSGVLVHSYTSATHAAEIAVLTATHQTALAKRAAEVLTLERQAAARSHVLEDAYVRMAEDRAEDGAEIARLSADLRAAVASHAGGLRKPAGGGGGGRVPAAAPDAGGCADLRAANGRLAGALERIVAGGAGIVADGQRAVDVATIAGQAARQQAQPLAQGE